MPIFLHVGCGPKHKDKTTEAFAGAEWQELRLDIDPSVQPDIVGSMTDIAAADESVDAVFSSHNIEHLHAHEVGIALAEFLRVLKADGFAVITCPDLQSVAALIAEDRLTDTAYVAAAGPITPLDILYGHRRQIAEGNLFMAHRCGFTKKALEQTLVAAGFGSVATWRRGHAPHFDLWGLATKRPVTEEALRNSAVRHFPLPG
jgi:predicted SAM-dependent methyltransferase